MKKRPQDAMQRYHERLERKAAEAQRRQRERDERELLALYEPLFSLFTPEQRAQAMQIEREHREAMFAWGVRSDYFLWVRTHPGEKPTWTHFLAWRLIDELERAS